MMTDYTNHNMMMTGAHIEERRERGKEHEVPARLINFSEFTHAARVTKNRHNHKVCSQEMAKFFAHNSSVGLINDPVAALQASWMIYHLSEV